MRHPSHRIARCLCAVVLCIFATLSLASCGETITFKTLKQDTDETGTAILATSVPPTQESFGFVEEITCGSGVTYTVSEDSYGSSFGIFASGIVPLDYGENVFFLIVKEDGNVIANHVVNIYRNRPVTVEFSTGLSEDTEKVYANEGDLITPPEAPTAAGYDFLGWAVCTYNEDKKTWKDGAIPFEFSYPPSAEEIYAVNSTYTVRFAALWDAHTDTPYKIEHYVEDTSGKYTLLMTEETTGTTGTKVNAKYLTKIDDQSLSDLGLEADRLHKSSVLGGTVAGDGSLVLRLYYTLERVTLGVKGEGGTVTKAGEYRYGASSFTATATPKTGFKFIGWYDARGKKLSDSTTYTFDCTQDVDARFAPDTSLNASDYFLMDGTTITGVKDTTATTLVIPSSVTAIAEGAFSDCTSLQSIYIPETVTTIEDDAFRGCYSYLTAYCEAQSRPEGWGSYWARRNQDNYYYGGYKNYFINDIHWGYAFE